MALFWAGTYTWDILNFLLPCFLILITLAAFGIDGYTDDNNLGFATYTPQKLIKYYAPFFNIMYIFRVVFIIFLFYGFSVLPFVYIFSFLFSSPAAGYIVVFVVNFTTGS